MEEEARRRGGGSRRSEEEEEEEEGPPSGEERVGGEEEAGKDGKRSHQEGLGEGGSAPSARSARGVALHYGNNLGLSLVEILSKRRHPSENDADWSVRPGGSERG